MHARAARGVSLSCNSARTLPEMTRELFDSFWRAVAYCLHPKVIALSLAPLVIVGGAAVALGYFYWEPALAGVRASLDESALLEPLFAWLRSIGAGNWASVLVPLIVVADDEESDVHAAGPGSGKGGSCATSAPGPAPFAATLLSSRRSRSSAASR